MKFLDMYTKVAPDLQQATARGGIFSLIAVGLMGWMLCVETWVFLGTGPIRERIDLELDVTQELRINPNIVFPRLACTDLTIELWRGKLRQTPRGMEKTLRISRFNPDTGKSKRYERIANERSRSGGKDDGFTGCKLEGFVNANNAPGSFKVSAPPNANLSHTINSFSFGMPLTRDQDKQLGKLSEKYRKVHEATLENTDYFYGANDKVFHHFIHVVPTKYQLHSRKTFFAYQTMHQNHLSHHDDDDADHWAVRFGFDISPMVARVTNQGSQRWYDFITSLLAILGGTFTVVQLVERSTSMFI